MNSKEVLEELKRTKVELERSDIYKKVQELTDLYVTLSTQEYEQEIDYIKTYYIDKGYECRNTKDCQIVFSEDYIGHSSLYDFIILHNELPEIQTLIITNVCTENFITFIDGSKDLLSNIVIGNSDTELNAWDDVREYTIR